MITDEEKRQIIDTCKEEVLLALPDVWSNLFLEIKAQGDLYEKFYKDHPDLKNHTDAVKSVFGEVTGEFPLLSHADQIGKALPRINQRVAETVGVNHDIPESVDLGFKSLAATLDTDNGAI